MKPIVQIEFVEVEPKEEYSDLIQTIIKRCFEEEHLLHTNLYVSITLTNPETIQTINREYRGIDYATDVLSFPMFEKEEIQKLRQRKDEMPEDVLGDIVISLAKVEEQAKEYGHSFQRELSYMVVHGFYHLMGYDHMEEEDKKQMRPKEEKILEDLKITRNEQSENK